MLRLKCRFDKLSKHNGAAKKCFFETFSPEKFMKLDTAVRGKHTLYNCMGCVNNSNHNDAINILQNGNPPKKNTQGKIPNIAEVIDTEELNKLNEAFSHTFKPSFSSIITNIPESQIIMKHYNKHTRVTDHYEANKARKGKEENKNIETCNTIFRRSVE